MLRFCTNRYFHVWNISSSGHLSVNNKYGGGARGRTNVPKVSHFENACVVEMIGCAVSSISVQNTDTEEMNAEYRQRATVVYVLNIQQ